MAEASAEAVEQGIPEGSKQVDIDQVNAIISALQIELNGAVAAKVKVSAELIIASNTIKTLTGKITELEAGIE